MNKRPLLIIALLIAVFAGAFVWKNMSSEPVAQFGSWGDCGDGICTEGYVLCPEDCPTECGNGYCDNNEIQEDGPYFCAQDCHVCANGGEWPSCCPEGRSGPYCFCDNGSNEPDCGEPEDLPCDEAEEMDTPECNPCMEGSCSDEDKCSGACTGPKERCEGAQLSDDERSNLCDCRNVEGADDFCKQNGIGFERPDAAKGDQGKYCDSSCKVTQCSDGKANEEESKGNPYFGIAPGETFNDDLADKNDIGCYDCADCAEIGEVTIENYVPQNKEYDECHDPYAYPKAQGMRIKLSMERPSIWASILAAILPNEPGGKVYQCAVQGQLAYDTKVPLPPDGKMPTSNFISAGAKVDQQACSHCVSVVQPDQLKGPPDAGKVAGQSCTQYIETEREKKNANLRAARDQAILRVGGEANLTQVQKNAMTKAINDKYIYETGKLETVLQDRGLVDNWCQSECSDPDNWPDIDFQGLGVPDALVASCKLSCACSCYPTNTVAEITPLIEKNRESRSGKDALDSENECFARCYYDADWKGGANGVEGCLKDCTGLFCPVQNKLPKDPLVNPPRGGIGGTSGGRGGSGGGECYGQFWNGCQYDICTIMSWYGMDCGPNFPKLPNIAGGAGGGGGGNISGTTGGGTSTPAKAGTTTGGGPGGGGPGGNPGGTPGGGSSASSRLSAFSSVRVSSAVSTFGFSSSRTPSSIGLFSAGSSRSSTSSAGTSSSSVPLFTRSSSRSSGYSSFGAYSSYLQVLACPQDACGANNDAGNTFCAQQGMTCVQSNAIPCIRCMIGEFGSSSFGDIPFGAASVSSVASRPSPLCGNGRADTGEECDDGNLSNFDGCTTACRIRATGSSAFSSPLIAAAYSSRPGFNPAFCGNDTLNEGEECDLGARNSDLPNASCRTDCSLSRCGDQVVDGVRNEQCDDGNATSGDGCSASCAIEQLAGQPNQVLPGSLVELPFVPGTPNQASVLPNIPAHGPVGDTGPEAVAIMAAGASAGYTWMRMGKKR